jgi:hypothetical protein
MKFGVVGWLDRTGMLASGQEPRKNPSLSRTIAIRTPPFLSFWEKIIIVFSNFKGILLGVPAEFQKGLGRMSMRSRRQALAK